MWLQLLSRLARLSTHGLGSSSLRPCVLFLALQGGEVRLVAAPMELVVSHHFVLQKLVAVWETIHRVFKLVAISFVLVLNVFGCDHGLDVGKGLEATVLAWLFELFGKENGWFLYLRVALPHFEL